MDTVIKQQIEYIFGGGPLVNFTIFYPNLGLLFGNGQYYIYFSFTVLTLRQELEQQQKGLIHT